MADFVSIEVTGLDVLQRNLNAFQKEIVSGMSGARLEIFRTIVEEEGLRTYPHETAANKEPYPFYIRGRGTQVSPSRNLGNSEKYGTQFYSGRQGTDIIIGNRASYAKYLAGKDTQARHMAKIGWKKLYDVATDKLPQIAKIYQGWIDRTIRKYGLK